MLKKCETKNTHPHSSDKLVGCDLLSASDIQICEYPSQPSLRKESSNLRLRLSDGGCEFRVRQGTGVDLFGVIFEGVDSQFLEFESEGAPVRTTEILSEPCKHSF